MSTISSLVERDVLFVKALEFGVIMRANEITKATSALLHSINIIFFIYEG